MLEGHNVSKRFGGLEALKSVDFYVDEKEIVGLIGPNGSGKTTLFNIISGVYRPDSGTIKFKGRDIVGSKPFYVRKIGISRTFQLTRPFLNMTALENVLIASLYSREKSVSISDARNEALSLLELVGLLEKKDSLARNLTLAERRLLEIARALAGEPSVVLLDEVVAGLNPVETLRAVDVIKSIHEKGITVFWVEHVMKVIMNVCHRILVLHHGKKIAEGTPKEVAAEDAVIKAYLGEAYVDA